MPALLFAGGDAIQKDVEEAIAASGNIYKKLTLDEKLGAFLQIAVERCSVEAGCSFKDLRPFVTDFIGFGASIYEPHHLMDVVKKAAVLGLTGIELHSVDLGGASVPAALEVARKLCAEEERLVLIAGAEAPRGGPASIAYYREVSDTLLEPTLEKHSEANLIALYALLADRLMTDSGISADDAENITAYYRSQALANERAATFGKPLKPGELKRHLAGIYSTPMVAVATDHGVAFLVANEKVLQRLEASGLIKNDLPQLYINAVGTNNSHKYVSSRADFMSPGRLAAKRAFAQLSLEPGQIDYAWIYDCFTLMLVRQAADYFDLAPKKAAETLAAGHLVVDGKRIPVNAQGGILNTQAAIALSAATGLIDIFAYAKEHPAAGHFLFGGNGGIDSTNSVAILSRTALERKPAVISAEQTRVIQPLPLAEDEELTLYAAVAVRFNPGSDVPFGLGAFSRSDGSLCLARILNADRTPCTDVALLPRDQIKLRLKIQNGRPFAVLP